MPTQLHLQQQQLLLHSSCSCTSLNGLAAQFPVATGHIVFLLKLGGRRQRFVSTASAEIGRVQNKKMNMCAYADV